MKYMAICERWERLTTSAGFGSPTPGWLQRLISAWTEPHRHYHTLEHLEECLVRLDTSAHLCRDVTAIELALWFHDAVYNPREADNEERSAAMAEQCLTEVQCATQLRKSVEKLILSTKAHECSGDPDVAIMLDIDLSVLGSGRQRFARYEEDVRREFAWVPAQVFAEKRAAILQGFLDRPFIYHTKVYREQREMKARGNLEWSIAQLTTR